MRNFEQLQMLLDEVNEMTNGAYENVAKYDSATFWNMLENRDVSNEDMANMVHFGKYNPKHEYIGYDGYGNIESKDANEYHKELIDLEEALEKEL